MNTETQVNELLAFVIGNLKELKSFALEYLPILAKEIVAYELYSSITIGIIALVVISIVYYLLYRLYKSEVKERTIQVSGPPLLLIWLLCTVIATAVIGSEIFDIIKTLNAPHLVIFEKITSTF